MIPVLTFVVPVRHQDNASDWPALKFRLTETISSISAQTNPHWRAVIVANHGADLPNLPQGFQVERVSFEPNANYNISTGDREVVYESVRLDKGRRVLSGMIATLPTKYFMIVDDDDFVSSELVRFVSQNEGSAGWIIKYGWVWSESSTIMLSHNNFSKYCGTSSIVRSDLYQIPQSVSAANDDYVKSYLGSHTKIEGILAERGSPLEVLPFRGAIYRVGHSGAHSRSTSLLYGHIFNPRLMSTPGKWLRNVFGLRRVNAAVRREFFGRN